MAFAVGGYRNERFQETVNDDLRCPLCMNVLREPVHCGPNEHYFCKSCIITHLRIAETCPCCEDELSIDTLRPSKFVTNRVNQLIISCDNAERGCEELIQLGQLDDHLESCGFSPIPCSNEGCSSVVNRKDYELHIKRECEFGDRCLESLELRRELQKVKGKLEEQCQDSTQLREEWRVMKIQLDEARQELRKAVDHVRQDFIIIGGCITNDQPNGTVQMFRWSTKTWEHLRSLYTARYEASAFAYDDQVIIAGGNVVDGGKAGRWKRLEKINFRATEKAAEWSDHDIKLPEKKSAHKCLVYEDRLLLIGGFSGKLKKCDDAIHDISLKPPYSSRVLIRMPSPRVYFGAEIFGDKVVIAGGSTTESCDTCLSTVTEYNVATNTLRELPPLPHPVSRMATVAWQDKLVFIGGMSKESTPLNTVILYDVGSGESIMLPCMKNTRIGATAIATGHVIVVMGGESKNSNGQKCFLNQVECFNFLTYTWENLPNLSTGESYAASILKPRC